MISNVATSEMNIYQNKNFDLPLSLLPKLKYNSHQSFNPPCSELVSVLGQFNYFKDSNQQQQQQLLQMAALKVSFKTFKVGEFIADSSMNDVFFILKGDIGVFEERNEREIKQEHYWQQQMEKIKRKMDQTNNQNEKDKLEEEFNKAEKVFNFYFREDQSQLLRKDGQRISYNFNLNSQCLYKQSQLIKSGVSFGFETDHSERNKNLPKHQFIALSTSLILTLEQIDYQEIFKKNAYLQNQLMTVLSKYFSNIQFEKELFSKIIKSTQEIVFNKNQLIYHENFDSSQNLYILIEGSVQITAKRLKQQILIEEIEPEQIFGCEFMASIRQLRQYTARSNISGTKVLIISYESMKQHFSNEIMAEIEEYGMNIYNKYQQIISSHIEHIISLCKTKGLKIPLNYQSLAQNKDNTINTSINPLYPKPSIKSQSPSKRSSLSRLSKKHSQIIEESLQNLKRQTSVHSGYQTTSTNTSSLQNSGVENKISSQILYNQSSSSSSLNRGYSSIAFASKSRQNSIDMEIHDNILPSQPKVQFLSSNPIILGSTTDLSNERLHSYYPKSLSNLPSFPSPKSTTQIKYKFNHDNSIQPQQQQQNNKQTQNQLLKRYLSSRYSKQMVNDNLEFQEDGRKVEPILRKSIQNITKDQLHNHLINLQNQQLLQQDITIKFSEDISPIKKNRNLSLRDTPTTNTNNNNNDNFNNNFNNTFNKNNNNFNNTNNALYENAQQVCMNQRRILRQFRVSEEVEKYIQQSNKCCSSVQGSPIKRNSQSQSSQYMQINPKQSSLDKYKYNLPASNHKQNKSLTSILSTSINKKQDLIQLDEYQTRPNQQLINNYCKSLTNI